MDPSKERRALSHGAHVVVGTPGRLRDHLERGALNLTALRTIVLDEADEMLDMGFREDLEEILDATPAGRRTLLFSATMPKPIVALARRYQRDALRISTVGEDRGHGDIAYQAITVAPAQIEHAVINLLRFHEAETAMLFCATRDNVRHLHAALIERGFAAVALSGEHSQAERNNALQALRDRRARPRPADAQPGDPRRDPARCRSAPAPLGPHGPGRQKRHRGDRGPLSAPQAGRGDAARRADRG
jgi:ATP-dependent RNA helicase DeaD